MRLNINNLAFIHKADMALDGITCIAGENNAGKSTVGKVLFALVFGLNQYRDLFEEDRIEFLGDRIRLLRLHLDRISPSFNELLSDACHTHIVKIMQRYNYY